MYIKYWFFLTHHSKIPTFHYSNCERSELSSNLWKMGGHPFYQVKGVPRTSAP
jgi:hypothetical protein